MSTHINETVIKQDVIQCENHEWVHDNNTMVLTCNPPIHVNKKVCSNCGQIVEVREQTFIQNNFNEIYQKFHTNNEASQVLKSFTSVNVKNISDSVFMYNGENFVLKSVNEIK